MTGPGVTVTPRLSTATTAEIEADLADRRDDRRLLADTLRWARTQGYSRAREYECGQFCGYSWVAPYQRVTLDPGGDLTIYVGRHAISPESAREGVDVLAALGVLPQEFSSAYQAGVNRCHCRAAEDDYHTIAEHKSCPSFSYGEPCGGCHSCLSGMRDYYERLEANDANA